MTRRSVGFNFLQLGVVGFLAALFGTSLALTEHTWAAWIVAGLGLILGILGTWRGLRRLRKDDD